MRRQTRNYLIGAVILIALGVLVVIGFVEISQIDVKPK